MIKVEPHTFEPLTPGLLWRMLDRAMRDLPLFRSDDDACRRCLRPRRMHPVRDWSVARSEA